MKRKNLFISLLFIVLCLVVTGCGEQNIKANQSVSLLEFYVPKDFKNRTDLRGLIYTDDTRKIFAKGDTNDYNTFIYIDVLKQANPNSLDDYINNVNKNSLTDKDVKFVIKENSKLYIFGREGYETMQENVTINNYAYITYIEGFNYTITISGAKNNKEVETIARNVLSSLDKVKTSG